MGSLRRTGTVQTHDRRTQRRSIESHRARLPVATELHQPSHPKRRHPIRDFQSHQRLALRSLRLSKPRRLTPSNSKRFKTIRPFLSHHTAHRLPFFCLRGNCRPGFLMTASLTQTTMTEIEDTQEENKRPGAITRLANNIRGAVETTPDSFDSQLSLFPNQKLFCVTTEPKRKVIKLPRSVLTIRSEEQLHQFLSRVAAAAMSAATRSYGSSAQAARRLGTTSDADPETPSSRPKLALARKS